MIFALSLVLALLSRRCRSLLVLINFNRDILQVVLLLILHSQLVVAVYDRDVEFLLVDLLVFVGSLVLEDLDAFGQLYQRSKYISVVWLIELPSLI